MKVHEIVKLHDDLRRALGWELTGNDDVWNPAAPDREDAQFVLLEHFKPAWDAGHALLVLKHMRLRGYGWNLDSYADTLEKPYSCSLTKRGEIVADCSATTPEIAICLAALEALEAEWCG